METFVLQINSHCNMSLGVKLKTSQFWFIWWRGTEQAKRHYVIEWRPSLLTHICVARVLKGSHFVNMCCTRRPSHWAYFDRIRNSMKIQKALVSNILNRSQRYFAHVTTVTLSWRVQNIVVIGRVYFTLECFEFSSNFEFDRNMLSGTGARALNEQFVSKTVYVILHSCCFFLQHGVFL